jgi:hypothetical protein
VPPSPARRPVSPPLAALVAYVTHRRESRRAEASSSPLDHCSTRWHRASPERAIHARSSRGRSTPPPTLPIARGPLERCRPLKSSCRPPRAPPPTGFLLPLLVTTTGELLPVIPLISSSFSSLWPNPEPPGAPATRRPEPPEVLSVRRSKVEEEALLFCIQPPEENCNE